jgi:hypothetical protein
MVKQDVSLIFSIQNCSNGNSGQFLKADDFCQVLRKNTGLSIKSGYYGSGEMLIKIKS